MTSRKRMMVALHASDSNTSEPLDDMACLILASVHRCTMAMQTTKQILTTLIEVINAEDIVAPQQCSSTIQALQDIQAPVLELHVLLEENAAYLSQLIPSSHLVLTIPLSTAHVQAEEVKQVLVKFHSKLLRPPHDEQKSRQVILSRLTSFRDQLQSLYRVLRRSFAMHITRYLRQLSDESEGEQNVEYIDPEKHAVVQHETQGGNIVAQNTLFAHGYALIVGVGDDLPVTVQDARAVAELLLDPQRCAYPAGQVLLLTEQQADRDTILQGLDWLIKTAQEDSEATVLVYFSGHGGDFPDYHLVPWAYDDTRLSSTAITGKEFTKKLQAIHAQKLLVVLDCCHAGGMASIKTPRFRSSPMPPELGTLLTQGSGKVVIASSRKDELSLAGTPYSEFTNAFLEALAGYGAAERDGYAYIADVAMYVGRIVANRTKDKQHPILDIHGADNFRIAYYAGGEKAPRPFEGVPIALFPVEMPDEDELIIGYRKIYRQYQENLLKIEERMAQFIDQAAVPLDLIRQRTAALEQIALYEQKIKKQT